jgi:hypothetical protein
LVNAKNFGRIGHAASASNDAECLDPAKGRLFHLSTYVF